MKNQKIGVICLLCVCLLIGGCAKIATPMGGPIDKDAPIVLRSIPAPGSCEVSPRGVELTFDEYIQLNNPASQITMNPKLQSPMSFKVDKRKLRVSWGDTLKKETTYILHFGEAIKDYNEGNVLKDYILPFSTGAYLDSLSFYGRVLDARTLHPVANVPIHLYTSFDDSVVCKQSPDYLAKSDSGGYFSFMFLGEDSMKVVGMINEGGLAVYGISTRKIAFDTQPITPRYYALLSEDDSLSSRPIKTDFLLFLFDVKPKEQSVIFSGAEDRNRWDIVFQHPVDSVELEWMEPSLTKQDFFAQWNAQRDTMTLWTWMMDSCDRKIAIEIGEMKDTLLIPFTQIIKTETKQRRGGSEAEQKLTSPKTNIVSSFSCFDSVMLVWDRPIASFNAERKTLLRCDEDTTAVTWKLSENRRSVVCDYSFQESKAYTFLVPDSLFFAIDGLTNDTIIKSFETDAQALYGTFVLDVILPENFESQCIFELVKDGQIVRKKMARETRKLSFDRLKAATYSIRCVYDQNMNGRWDSGEYWEHRYPEKVIEYPDKIEIPANWEVQEEWSLIDTLP